DVSFLTFYSPNVDRTRSSLRNSCSGADRSLPTCMLCWHETCLTKTAVSRRFSGVFESSQTPIPQRNCTVLGIQQSTYVLSFVLLNLSSPFMVSLHRCGAAHQTCLRSLGTG